MVGEAATQACGQVPSGDAAPVDPGEQLVGEASADEWREHTLADGGIDPDAWDPREGLRCNQDTIEAVYTQYAEMAEDHPDLRWAELAATAAPEFYAGWQDMVVIREFLEAGRRDELVARLQRLNAPDALVQLARHAAADQLRWFERRFLAMQKQIYDDLAWQHEAFANGGIEEMRRLHDTNELDRDALEAWERIAAGDVDEGGYQLLDREQRQIIQDDYKDMRQRTAGPGGLVPVGRLFTQSFGLMADSPVPGDQLVGVAPVTQRRRRRHSHGVAHR